MSRLTPSQRAVWDQLVTRARDVYDELLTIAEGGRDAGIGHDDCFRALASNLLEQSRPTLVVIAAACAVNEAYGDELSQRMAEDEILEVLEDELRDL